MNKKIECKPILFDSLSKEEIESYKKLVIPSALHLFDLPADPLHLLTGIEARLDNQLIGLIIAQFLPDEHGAHLYSCVIEESFRRKGIATFLFKSLQEHLTSYFKCTVMAFSYRADSPEEPIIEKILKHFNWPIPKYYLIRCHFLADNFNPPWYQEQLKLPKLKGFKIFPWKKLKPTEKERILFQEDQGMYLGYLSPFSKEETLSPLNSLGVRYKNKVVGWSITHRLDPHTIKYSILYMEKGCRLQGIWLISQSIKIQKEHSSIFTHAIFDTNYGESELSWWRFVVRHLAPYAEKVEKFKWAIKAF